MKFYWIDLDLDPKILVLKLDLYIVKIYVCAKNEAPTINGSEVIAWTDTDRHTDSSEIISFLHTRMVNIVDDNSIVRFFMIFDLPISSVHLTKYIKAGTSPMWEDSIVPSGVTTDLN